MSTLAEMGYHVQDMPDGCWNCKHYGQLWYECWQAPRIESGTPFVEEHSKVEFNGICDRHEKEGE
jgi:hypothetical protein